MSKRSGSEIPQFRVRVPAAVAARLKGKRVLFYLSGHGEVAATKVVTIGDDIAFSLGTTDPLVAAKRQANVLDHCIRLFDLSNTEPARLSHRDMVALSGAAYRLYIDVNGADPGNPFDWRFHKAIHRATVEGRISNPPAAMILPGDDGSFVAQLFGDEQVNLTDAVNALPKGQHDSLEARFGLLADWVLTRHSIRLPDDDRCQFLKLIGAASIDAGWQLRRNAEGDYSPDPKAARFPAIETVAALKPKITMTALLDGWWKEAQATGRAENTRQAYRYAISRLREHVGHDDAARVSEADIIAFKDARLQVVSAKTLKDADLAGIRAVFRWGLNNRKIASNPAAHVHVQAARPVLLRSPGFSDEEAASIFDACDRYERKPKESDQTAAAKRWAPVIAAYTGARISEILQLRKQDVFQSSGHSCINITPEAGTVKSGQYRVIPLHRHIIEKGFLDFVSESQDGPLFAAGSYKRVVDFVRSVVSDPNVQPNHGWRHRLKTIARDLAKDHRVVDAIQGHAPRTASDRYGVVSVAAMAHVIADIPTIGL